MLDNSLRFEYFEKKTLTRILILILPPRSILQTLPLEFAFYENQKAYSI